ncbi:Tyramine receptor [Carabus blaptoides fortunei]
MSDSPPLQPTDSSSTVESTGHPSSWQEISLAGLLCIVIVVTVIGNTLVIMAILTTRRLRTVTNCFVMSLAVADWLVGIFVMPPAVALQLMGSWQLGWILCDIWISLDVLLCTASILSLCAISVDRYLAVTQPLNYSRKRRSKRLALSMILVVWIAALAITCPPILGWHEPKHHEQGECRYNQNQGYVVFSACGSFFIPMTIMVYVYVRISCVVAQRHDQLANIDTRPKKSQKIVLGSRENSEMERISSDCEEGNPTIRCTNINSTELNHHDQKSHQSRSLRSNLTYTFNSEALTPQRTASLYTPNSTNRSRPESLNLDVSVLNFEPATRVSSFRRETKTAQTLSIVVGGFVACWLPFFIYYLLTPFLPLSAVSKVLMAYLTWLGWINSAINPFIYAFYSPDFRIAFWRLTVKHFTKNRRSDFAFQHK